MNITIKRISLLNFKGVRQFDTDFDEKETTFRGDNATGKTTLFDAFTWCLYDKDSQGRSNFQVKTLDEHNEVIWKQPHEVTVVLDVDGEEVTIRKSLKEVWTKKRGKMEAEFTGHTVERFWNDVPVKEKEFNEKINEICKEETFRLITNPMYFLNNLSVKDQREFLIRLAGEITPEDIAAKHAEFQKLVEDMSGKTADEYAREIGSKIKRIKTEAETLPARIDERKRDTPESYDWDALQKEIDTKQGELDEVEKSLQSLVDSYNAASKEQRERMQHKSDLEISLEKKRNELKNALTKSYFENKSKQAQIRQQIDTYERDIKYYSRLKNSSIDEDKALYDKRETLVSEWHEIKKRYFDRDSIDRNEFVCPTCHRKLEESNIDEQIDKMEGNYNAETTRLLDENKKKGLAIKQKRETIAQTIEAYEKKISEITDAMEKLTKDPYFDAVFDEPDTSHIDDEPEIKKIKKAISEADQEIRTHIVAEPMTDEIKVKRVTLQNEINNLKVKLGNKQQIERNEARIAELEKQYKKQNEEISELEGVLFQIDQFKHTVIDEVENTINGMFSFVRFKMYEQQINGGERETCEALVNGVPYSTNVNTAARVNAGIDIINAICRKENVHAPIFIDNRESVTNVIDTDSQIVNLVKDENYTYLTRM
jgi:exonuclease SbcC